jgi:hypothetical protein
LEWDKKIRLMNQEIKCNLYEKEKKRKLHLNNLENVLLYYIQYTSGYSSRFSHPSRMASRMPNPTDEKNRL